MNNVLKSIYCKANKINMATHVNFVTHICNSLPDQGCTELGVTGVAFSPQA